MKNFENNGKTRGYRAPDIEVCASWELTAAFCIGFSSDQGVTHDDYEIEDFEWS